MEERLRQKRLAELRKSVSQMTDDELYAEIGASRNNRHTPTKPKKKAKKVSTKVEKKKGTSDLDKALSELTPEQAKALLGKLEG